MAQFSQTFVQKSGKCLKTLALFRQAEKSYFWPIQLKMFLLSKEEKNILKN